VFSVCDSPDIAENGASVINKAVRMMCATDLDMARNYRTA
jgi:hypothetical protein